MTEKNSDLEPASMTDDELDDWLSKVNDDLSETLDHAVDTEAALLHLKQSVLNEAVAVAHKSGGDGADRAIWSVVLNHGSSPTTGTAPRTARGRLGRVLHRIAASESAVRFALVAVVALGCAEVLLAGAAISGSLRFAADAPPRPLIALGLGASFLTMMSAVFWYKIWILQRQRQRLQSRHRWLEVVVTASCLRRRDSAAKPRTSRRALIGQAAIRWMAHAFSTPAVYFIEQAPAGSEALITALAQASDQGVEAGAEPPRPSEEQEHPVREAELITSGSRAIGHGQPERNNRRNLRPAARPSDLERRRRRRRGGRNPKDPA